MKKAKLIAQNAQVKEVIKSYAVEVQTDHKEDLAEEKVNTSKLLLHSRESIY
jgi:hypothetical protein